MAQSAPTAVWTLTTTEACWPVWGMRLISPWRCGFGRTSRSYCGARPFPRTSSAWASPCTRKTLSQRRDISISSKKHGQMPWRRWLTCCDLKIKNQLPAPVSNITLLSFFFFRFWKIADTFTGLKLKGHVGHFGKFTATDIEGFVELPDGKVSGAPRRTNGAITNDEKLRDPWSPLRFCPAPFGETCWSGKARTSRRRFAARRGGNATRAWFSRSPSKTDSWWAWARTEWSA